MKAAKRRSALFVCVASLTGPAAGQPNSVDELLLALSAAHSLPAPRAVANVPVRCSGFPLLTERRFQLSSEEQQTVEWMLSAWARRHFKYVGPAECVDFEQALAALQEALGRPPTGILDRDSAQRILERRRALDARPAPTPAPAAVAAAPARAAPSEPRPPTPPAAPRRAPFPHSSPGTKLEDQIFALGFEPKKADIDAVLAAPRGPALSPQESRTYCSSNRIQFADERAEAAWARLPHGGRMFRIWAIANYSWRFAASSLGGMCEDMDFAVRKWQAAQGTAVTGAVTALEIERMRSHWVQTLPACSAQQVAKGAPSLRERPGSFDFGELHGGMNRAQVVERTTGSGCRLLGTDQVTLACVGASDYGGLAVPEINVSFDAEGFVQMVQLRLAAGDVPRLIGLWDAALGPHKEDVQMVSGQREVNRVVGREIEFDTDHRGRQTTTDTLILRRETENTIRNRSVFTWKAESAKARGQWPYYTLSFERCQ